MEVKLDAAQTSVAETPTSTAPKPSGRRINYSQDTPTRTKLAIPEDIKGFGHPACINTFINRIYPNLKAYVDAYMPRNDHHDELVNETIQIFIAYMLAPAPSRDNVPRWTLYDPEFNQGRMPYYKWFLTQCSFVIRDRLRTFAKDQFVATLSESGFEETAESPANNAVNIETLDIEEYRADPSDEIHIEQLRVYLKMMATRHSGQNTFEANALKLFTLKMDEYDNREIADRFKISVSAVQQWSTKLKAVCEAFLKHDRAKLSRFLQIGVVIRD